MARPRFTLSDVALHALAGLFAVAGCVKLATGHPWGLAPLLVGLAMVLLRHLKPRTK